ncbi:MAG: invasion associated locus B family protein [Pseudomonadota bacterium]
MRAAKHPLFVAVVALFATSGFGWAQAPQNPPDGFWFKTCQEEQGSKICTVQFNVLSPAGKLRATVNLSTLTGKINSKLMRLIVPTGRYIPDGITIQVDQSRKNKVPYTICSRSSCFSQIQMSDELVRVLKRGGKMYLTTTNFQEKKISMEITLKGFTKSFDGPPLTEAELREMIELRAIENANAAKRDNSAASQ